METTEFYNIIDEYIAQNNISCITEEEVILLFGESLLSPNYYLPAFAIDFGDVIILTDYELYLLGKGINIVEPNPKTEYQKKLADEFYADVRMDKYRIGIGFNECLQEGEWEYELDQELSKKSC